MQKMEPKQLDTVYCNPLSIHADVLPVINETISKFHANSLLTSLILVCTVSNC